MYRVSPTLRWKYTWRGIDDRGGNDVGARGDSPEVIRKDRRGHFSRLKGVVERIPHGSNLLLYILKLEVKLLRLFSML